ncbi:hypothetical protein BKA70DRAFT_1567298 [Coprinopsis sp. MPI-PUGE-AT-0042]|nr:hypothetical protein BKA70DRAFT_1567298 [Coprinopsis sp. MPI-PUGE-AT-0042]
MDSRGIAQGSYASPRMALLEERMREMLWNVLEAHPNGTVVHRYAEYTSINPRALPSLKRALSHSILPPLVPLIQASSPKTAISSLMKISLSAQTQQTRIIEATLLATPSTSLNPAPRAILTTMRGSHGEIEGRAVLFKLDEDIQVVIKADGGHGVDGDSEELGSEDEDGNYAIRSETSTSTGNANKGVAEGELDGAIGFLGYKRLLAEWLSQYANSASSTGRSAANDGEFFISLRMDGVPRTQRAWAEQVSRGTIYVFWLLAETLQWMDVRWFTALATNYESTYFAHFTSRTRQYQHIKHSVDWKASLHVKPRAIVPAPAFTFPMSLRAK